MTLGIISDTHNYFDPRIPELFTGVEHILHAGDIGLASIVFQLEQIAPVTAVLGNNDFDSQFRETEVVALAARKFLVHHIVNPHHPSAPLQQHLMRERPQVVVFGHTHQPFAQTVGDTFFFNPGYAGKRRFALERTVALLHCDERGIRHEFLSLD